MNYRIKLSPNNKMTLGKTLMDVCFCDKHMICNVYLP
jgi:hypothetical protein